MPGFTRPPPQRCLVLLHRLTMNIPHPARVVPMQQQRSMLTGWLPTTEKDTECLHVMVFSLTTSPQGGAKPLLHGRSHGHWQILLLVNRRGYTSVISKQKETGVLFL